MTFLVLLLEISVTFQISSSIPESPVMLKYPVTFQAKSANP